MRKLFSLIAAVLFAGSMMADPIVINASDVTTIASGATSGLDVTLQGINIVWQGAYYNPDGSGSVDFRVYANKSMTLTAESNISKVEIAGYCKAGLTVTANAGTITTGASYASETTKGTLEDPLIVVDEIGATSVTLTCTKQMRAYTIRVTLGEGGGDTPGGDTPGGDTPGGDDPVVTDPTNCAEAATAALSVSANNELYNGGKEYTIQGYVTEIAFAYDATKGNMSFWMADTKDGGKVLEAYKCTITSEENAPAVGDKVAVTGKLTKYNTTPEFATGCTVVIIEKAGGDTPGGDDPVVTDPTNCAEAATGALSVSKNNEEYNGGKEYTIQGYVTEIAFAYDATKGNMSFWMADTKDGGKVLEAYKCTITSEENAPAVGDKVAVTGKLTKYNTTPEFATGCTVVIIEKAGGDTPGGDDPVVTDPTNCAEAATAALSVSKNNEFYNNGKEYTITGYVTSIQTAYNSQFNNITFWMADAADGGNVLEAYRAVCESAEAAPTVGDKVTVTGKLTKYNTTPEFAQGCTYVIVEKSAPATNLGAKTIAEFLALKNTKDTCILTGVVANITSTTYGNFDLCDKADTVYIYGLLTPDGKNKQFESLNVAENDTLTVLAVYGEHNGKPQVNNAIFVEVKKAGGVTPGAEVEITIADGSFSDYVESYGYWLVEAQNVDYYISLSNDNTQITQAAGTYTAADLYAKDSYILTETDSISFVSGSIVLAVNTEGVATVTGSLVGNDGNTYILNIVCPAPDEHEYDEDSDFIRNFSSYTINTEYLSDYGDINVEASDADGYQITLDLYVPTGASGLVAGTYEINSTYEAGTVAAGIFYDGGIYPSFAGIATTEGLTNVWYLVSGTVVVDANLNITVNAVNSLGHSVKATLSADSGTGIEETLAAGKAAKTLRNGHILILKGDKTYNVLGAHIR